MQKYLLGCIVCSLRFVSGLFTISNAQSSNCHSINFSNGTVCLWIEKQSHNQYRVTHWISNTSNNAVSLYCDIDYGPNRENRVHIPNCDASFTYNSNNTELVNIDVYFANNPVRRTTVSYNFLNGWTNNRSNNGGNPNTCWNCHNNLYDLDLLAGSIYPSINQAIDVNILALQSPHSLFSQYQGTVQFTVEYRTSSTSTWQTAPSSYYSLNRSRYTFASHNNGSVDLSGLITFHNNGHYRLIARDGSISRDITFFVGGSTNQPNNTQLNHFTLSASRTNPSTQQYVDLSIQARQRNGNLTTYNNTVTFSVEYRANNNAVWQNAPSSYYFLNRSSYTFGWSDYGFVTLSNLIQFSSNGLYRLTVRDSFHNVSSSVIFTVGGSSNDTQYGNFHNFGLSSNPSNPARNQFINVSIQARDSANRLVSNYTRNISFAVQYRSNNSLIRQTAPSSSYSLNRSSYTFAFNDYGSVTLNNLLLFNSNGEYRLVVQDTWNNIVGYLYFTIGSTSNTPGFSTTQLQQIQGIYNLWPSFIANLTTKYSRLRTNTTWDTRQIDLYREMYNITRNVSSVYSNYDQFFAAFTDRYIYTLQVR